MTAATIIACRNQLDPLVVRLDKLSEWWREALRRLTETSGHGRKR